MTRSRHHLIAHCLAWAMLTLALAPAAHARTAAEDKLPGFKRYEPVEVTSIYWKDKHWEKRDTVTVDLLDGFSARPDARCPYGGLEGTKGDKATGFFHAAKLDGRWCLVDPDGHRFLTVGVCSVSVNDMARGRKALQDKFGDKAGWARAALAQMNEMGYNTLGCWSDWQTFKEAGLKVPYTVQLNWMAGYGKQRGGTFSQPGHTGYPNNCIFVFDPQFEEYCNKQAAKLAENKNDAWLFGYFSDNEMPLQTANLENYLKGPAGDPGRAAAEKFLTERYGATDKKKITDKDRDDFLKIVTERYYRIVSTAIKKVDPNHIYLGSRLHGANLRQECVFAGVAPYVDVCAVNYYNDWSPNYEHTHMWVRAMDKPYIITEFYAKGMDSAMGNTGGAGWTVHNQADRGKFYQNFCIGLLGDPGCVGWHYFKYMDNDPSNTKTDASNRDSNKGYVNYLYEPWAPIVDAMRALNTKAYAVREYLLKR